jgi:beta-glucosidase
VRHAAEVFGVKTFYMTENGATFHDEITPDGEVLDLHRREYLRNYLVELHRAVAEGYDVRGFFVWSLLDNFEWAEGYGKRFGIVHVDFATQQRTPKLSSRWYSEVMRNNRIV